MSSLLIVCGILSSPFILLGLVLAIIFPPQLPHYRNAPKFPYEK